MASDGAGDPDFMRSLARGMTVIQALCDARRPQTIATLSEKTGMSRATARRCLYTLRQLGYLSEELRTFALTPKVLTLGDAYLSSTPLTILAQPHLEHIRRTLNESSSLAVLDDNQIMYVARASTSPLVSASPNVGSRLPAYCTALGQAMLAHLPASRLDDYFERTGLTGMTEHTVVSRQRLRKILAKVRQAGYALNDEEPESGLCSIAVPVRAGASGPVLAAMNVAAPAASASAGQLTSQFLPVLRQAASELSARLR